MKTKHTDNMSKQTAVEWLSEKLWNEFGIAFSNNILEQAKELEKNQIVEAYVKGCKDTYGQKEPLGSSSDEYIAECYYSQTYKQ